MIYLILIGRGAVTFRTNPPQQRLCASITPPPT